MTKIIGLCNCTAGGNKSRLAPNLSVHLDNHFGKSKVLSRQKVSPPVNRRSMSVDSFTSCILDVGLDLPKVHRIDFESAAPMERSLQIRMHSIASEYPIFNWSAVSKALNYSAESEVDFLLIDTDFDQSFLAEAKLSSVVDILIVLDHQVRQDSDNLQFVKSAVEQIENCRIGVIVDTGRCLGEALDIYSHFEVFVGPTKNSVISFLGHLPQTQNMNRNGALEIMALQNIALGLLNLNCEATPHSIPSEMFEGFLH